MFIGHCQTVPQSPYAILHHLQDCVRVPVAPHPHQELTLLGCLNFSHLNRCVSNCNLSNLFVAMFK